MSDRRPPVPFEDGELRNGHLTSDIFAYPEHTGEVSPEVHASQPIQQFFRYPACTAPQRHEEITAVANMPHEDILGLERYVGHAWTDEEVVAIYLIETAHVVHNVRSSQSFVSGEFGL